MSDRKIDSLRRAVDKLDRRLVEILNERAALAVRIGERKREGGGDAGMCRPDREAEILRDAAEASKGPLKPEHLGRIYREVISACLALEAEVRVGFLGPEGTFSHEAALAQFGRSAKFAAMESSAEVVDSVEKGVCDFGLIPVENSTEGTVGQTLDIMFRSPVAICAEQILRIRQHLLARPRTKLAEIERIYSHPQSFAQCRAWLRKNLPHAELIDSSSNAAAAQRVGSSSSACAAIAPLGAAQTYGLAPLANDIEDDTQNTTRFWVVGSAPTRPTGRDKTSIAITAAADRAGGLLELLTPLAKQGINMSKLESRPARAGKKWDYIFFIDLDGHADDPAVAKALRRIEGRAGSLRVLGSYPAAG